MFFGTERPVATDTHLLLLLSFIVEKKFMKKNKQHSLHSYSSDQIKIYTTDWLQNNTKPDHILHFFKKLYSSADELWHKKDGQNHGILQQTIR